MRQTRSKSYIQPSGARRYFTPAEANRALVLVKRIVADVVQSYANMYDLQEAMEMAQESGAFDRCEGIQRQLVEVASRLQKFAAELDDVGVELKDWAAGVVDFPCMLDGREVYLSWRHGEERVEYWHEMSQDFSARQVLGEMFEESAAASLQAAAH